MVTAPALHDPTTTVEQARVALGDPHRHMLLLVAGPLLIGTLTRDDLGAEAVAEAPATRLARLAGRTSRPEDALEAVWAQMVAGGERRRAVVDAAGVLLGLLCLKASRSGFCSDAGIAARAHAAAS